MENSELPIVGEAYNICTKTTWNSGIVTISAVNVSHYYNEKPVGNISWFGIMKSETNIKREYCKGSFHIGSCYHRSLIPIL